MVSVCVVTLCMYCGVFFSSCAGVGCVSFVLALVNMIDQPTAQWCSRYVCVWWGGNFVDLYVTLPPPRLTVELLCPRYPKGHTTAAASQLQLQPPQAHKQYIPAKQTETGPVESGTPQRKENTSKEKHLTSSPWSTCVLPSPTVAAAQRLRLEKSTMITAAGHGETAYVANPFQQRRWT